MIFELRQPGLALLLAATALLSVRSLCAAELIKVPLDRARLVKLPDRVGTVVVGNPLIADASVQANGLLVITGKGYGRTNIIVLDGSGAVLTEKIIQIEGPHETVVVYRGPDRESYSCAPKCERRITLGDAQPYFDQTLAETVSRNNQAIGAAPGASSGR